MSTIKSSAENLTLNADGANNDVIIQSNGSTLVTVDGSATNVGIGTTTPAQKLSLNTGYVQVGNGIGGGGGVKYPYSAANADCRNWRTRSDMQEYGDWGIEQSTTQSGESYSHKFKITQAGDVIVNTGDLIFGTANKGIVLGATTNVDANTLDDYEEGTCTIQYSDGSTTIGNTPNTAKYTKIGRTVTVNGYINATNTDSLSGSTILRLVGFPFTNSIETAFPVFTRYLNAPDNTNNIVGYFGGNGTFAYLYYMPDNASYHPVACEDLSTSSNDLYFSVTYTV
jgi:hypothetical protein